MEKPEYAYYEDIKSNSSAPWKISDVIFIYFCIFILSMIFMGSMLYANININANTYSIIFQALLSLSILVLIYLIVTQKYNMSFKDAFGIYFEKMPIFMRQGIIVTAIMVGTTTLIGLAFSLFTGIESGNPYSEMPIEKFRWLTFLALFFAPIVEEFFFRGFMQPAIIKKTGVFSGILITALIFGLSHFQYMDYTAAIISVTAIGLILGIVRYKTGSVMPGIFAHFFNNLLAIAHILY
ncbi:MAG TPA: type II CAAX endopeptidase family protein [Candidatus Gastranaerophilales bacterium]|nr:type II CAAX endopeptidase family protein [Candidatus Gastranaerophilales bacterium]